MRAQGILREISQKLRDGIRGLLIWHRKSIKIKSLVNYQNLTKFNQMQMPLMKHQCNDNLLQFGAMFWFQLDNISKTRSTCAYLAIFTHYKENVLRGIIWYIYALFFAKNYNRQNSRYAAKTWKVVGPAISWLWQKSDIIPIFLICRTSVAVSPADTKLILI